MKKHFIIFLLSLILLSFTANAADINIAHIEFDKFDFADDKPIFSLLSEEKNFRMDFSLLEGVLTVEIIDSSTLEGITSEEAGGMVLFISDYNEKDVLLDMHRLLVLLLLYLHILYLIIELLCFYAFYVVD